MFSFLNSPDVQVDEDRTKGWMTMDKIKLECPKIYSKELVEIIFENPYSKIDFFVKKLNINRKTASKYFNELEDKNILSHIQIGKEKVFINNDLMTVLGD